MLNLLRNHVYDFAVDELGIPAEEMKAEMNTYESIHFKYGTIVIRGHEVHGALAKQWRGNPAAMRMLVKIVHDLKTSLGYLVTTVKHGHYLRHVFVTRLGFIPVTAGAFMTIYTMR